MPSVPLPANIPAGVSVTVEEFGDYQCPPCGLLHPELKQIAAEYGNKVNFVFRNFPLTMNHKNALAAFVFIRSVTIATETAISPSLTPFLSNINEDASGWEPSRFRKLLQRTGCVAPASFALKADS